MTITPSDLRALADAMPAAIDDPETRTAWVASAFAALHRAIAQMQARDVATERLREAAQVVIVECQAIDLDKHSDSIVELRAALDAAGVP